ncbi:MAG: Holliday junction resolvase RuvX [Bacilli bacterium]|nr:Holliday junction resolvase RuvX [Bacilli bacterium]
MEKYIGLDLGTVTLGIATSDSLGFVHGLETFRFPKEAYSQARKRVHEVVASTGIKNIVIGLPINMDGSEGFRAQSSRKFAEDLSNEDANLKIYLQDERLTSVSAHKTLSDLNVSHKQRKESVDRLAACEILDFYIRVNGGK